MTATSDFLLADARAALRRRLAEPDRTDLSRGRMSESEALPTSPGNRYIQVAGPACSN